MPDKHLVIRPSTVFSNIKPIMGTHSKNKSCFDNLLSVKNENYGSDVRNSLESFMKSFKS